MEVRQNVQYQIASSRQVQDWNYNQGLSDDQSAEILSFSFERQNLNTVSLKNTIRLLFQRHDILRTYFEKKGNQLFQVILPFDVGLFDLKQYIIEKVELSEEYIASTISLCHSELKNIKKAPLVHCLLFTNDQYSTFNFKFIIHHIISDAESIKILKREINELYRSFVNQSIPELPKIPYQLRQYLDHEQVNTDHNKKKLQNYWKTKLQYIETREVSKKFITELSEEIKVSNLLDSRSLLMKRLELSSGRLFTSYTDCDAIEIIRLLKSKYLFSLNSILSTTFLIALFTVIPQDDYLMVLPISGRFSVKSQNIVGNLMGGIYYHRRRETKIDLKNTIQGFQEEYFKSCRYLIYNHELLDLDLENLRLNCDLFLNIFKNPDSELRLKDKNVHFHETIVGSYYFLECCVENNESELRFDWKYNTSLYSKEKIELISKEINSVILSFKSLL